MPQKAKPRRAAGRLGSWAHLEQALQRAVLGSALRLRQGGRLAGSVIHRGGHGTGRAPNSVLPTGPALS